MHKNNKNSQVISTVQKTYLPLQQKLHQSTLVIDAKGNMRENLDTDGNIIAAISAPHPPSPVV